MWIDVSNRFSILGHRCEQCPVCFRIVCEECRRYKVRTQQGNALLCKFCFESLALDKVRKKFRAKCKQAEKSDLLKWYNAAKKLIEDIETALGNFKYVCGDL